MTPPARARVSDKREPGFTILDDEVIDDPRLKTGERAAYWSLCRHGRRTGGIVRDVPTAVLLSGAGMKKRDGWARACRGLEARGYIKVDWNPSGGVRANGSRTHQYEVLPVLKAPSPRDRIRDTAGRGSSPIAGGIVSGKRPRVGPENGHLFNSETLFSDTRQEDLFPSVRGEQDRRDFQAGAFGRAWFARHGRWPWEKTPPG